MKTTSIYSADTKILLKDQYLTVFFVRRSSGTMDTQFFTNLLHESIPFLDREWRFLLQRNHAIKVKEIIINSIKLVLLLLLLRTSFPDFSVRCFGLSLHTDEPKLRLHFAFFTTMCGNNALSVAASGISYATPWSSPFLLKETVLVSLSKSCKNMPQIIKINSHKWVFNTTVNFIRQS